MMTLDKTKSYDFLTPLERGPRGHTTEQVERSLRSAIVALDFAPGEFIDKAAVCDTLGVSRFPVSEALARLASEGLVEILPQRGTRAALIRLSEIKESMLIRRALEVMVAEDAAIRLPSTTLATLRANLEAQRNMVAIDDLLGFHALDLEFHKVLIESLELPRVAAVIDSSRANIDRVRRLLSSSRRHADTLAEHWALYQAIEARDPAAASMAMRAHLGAVMEELERLSLQNAGLFTS